MNINDYKDTNGNVEVSETLVSDLIGGINTNETDIADVAKKLGAFSVENPLTQYKAMTNGGFHIGWQWAVTTGNNWPVNTSGYNLIFIARGNSDYGFAIAITANSKTYTATLRDGLSTITWTVLN